MKKLWLVAVVLMGHMYAEDIYATFNIEAKKSANLSFEMGGIVAAVHVDIGQVISADTVLAALRDSDLQSALNVAKANTKKAEVALKYAKSEFQRQEKLRKIIDASSFEKFALAYESAQATLELMRASEAYQQALLAKTVLKAPFDGIIFDKALEKGDALGGGVIKTVLKIQSIHERKLILEFDQQFWDVVKVGDAFTYKIDGKSQEFVGKISTIYPNANSTNRKIKAEVWTRDLPVGLFGSGMISTGQ